MKTEVVLGTFTIIILDPKKLQMAGVILQFADKLFY